MGKIPVFVSCPTLLSKDQEVCRQRIINSLIELNIEPRSLGRSDYPHSYPLREVYILAKQCAGGIILGFEQIHLDSGTKKRGTTEEKVISKLSLPTPWNHIESGIMFGLKIPLLVFKENGIEGGIFDIGTSDLFIHQIPTSDLYMSELKEVMLKWYSVVNIKYYSI